MRKKAFTLIELLVVIVIIGILSGISVSSFKSYQNKANIAKVIAETKPILDAIIIARTLSEKPLIDITNYNASGWLGCHSIDIRNIADNSTCMTNWNNARNKIANASGIDLAAFSRDPWGSPYLLDENEGERPFPDYCIRDIFRSAGPNGFSGDSDDTEIEVPFYDIKQCGT